VVIDALGGIAGLLLTVLLISGWVVMEFRDAQARKEAELERERLNFKRLIWMLRDGRDARGRFTKSPR